MYSSVLSNFLQIPSDPWKHILVDDESEKKWGFKLNASLTQAAKEPLLRGYKVGATKKCLPPPDQLKGKKKCSLSHCGMTYVPNYVIVCLP